MPLQPFVVNLNGGRYLRLVLQLELDEEDSKAEVEGSLAQVRDRLIFLLSGKTYDDVQSMQGKYQLQGEITKSLNDLFHDPIIERVYFTEFIVQ
jgi:flagellar FliL protein